MRGGGKTAAPKLTFFFANKNNRYEDKRHFYFKSVEVQNKKIVLIFVVDLKKTERPNLLSYQKVDDIFKRIYENDVIIYKNGQETEIKLQKATLNP